jgi:lactobin A/cerein 7B family class IIb bacteriocin
MKKQNVNGKLAFNKATLVELNDEQLQQVEGGTAPVVASAVASAVVSAAVASAVVSAAVSASVVYYFLTKEK